MGAKIHYDKLLRECLVGAYSYEQVPDRYKAQVKEMADADLLNGTLPQWQYDLMGFPVN